MSAASTCASTSSGAACGGGQRRGRVDAVDPAQQPDLGQPGLGGLVGRAVGEDLPVRPLGRVQVAVDQRVVGRQQARVLGRVDLDAAGLEHRVDPLAQLRLGDHPGERVDRLPADDREAPSGCPAPGTPGRCRGLASTSTLAEHPGAAALDGELLQHRARAACTGSHHSAQKSMITGVVSDRSSTSVWKVASVTSMTSLRCRDRRSPASRSRTRRRAAGTRAGPGGLGGSAGREALAREAHRGPPRHA